ncbi:hypothetical protein ACLOJK_009383 [Asimina triloba]
MACFDLPLFFMIKPHLFLTISLIFSSADAVLGRYASVFSFGDSLIDTGNRFYIDDADPMGRFPYGMSFFHHPTGRSSDGRVVVDFIAEALGIPFLPPYLASHSDSQQLRHGANFAVAGATALPADFFMEREIEGVLANVSLGNQIAWFLDHLPSLCTSPSVCGNPWRETLFLVGEIGVNDYCIPFDSGLKLEEIRTFVPQVVSTVALAVDVSAKETEIPSYCLLTLIKHGATSLVVPGVMPLGCYADTLTISESSNKEDYEPQTGCLKNWNELCQYHNRLLNIELSRLRDMHPHATIAYADYYNAVLQVFPSPQQFGELASSSCTFSRSLIAFGSIRFIGLFVIALQGLAREP